MTNLNHKSVFETFTQKILIIISFSVITITALISYFAYTSFLADSKRFENEYIASQKAKLQHHVESVERIINYNRSKLNETIRNNIKGRVYEAHNIATKIHQQYKNRKSKNEIINLIKDAIRPFRFFDGRGYIFIDSLSGKNILHPIIPHIEGTSVLKFKDKKGVPFARNLLKIAKEKGEGYYTYDWVKPNEEGQFTKVSFVKHFKPYNWSIGTGDYLIDVERKIQTDILNRIGEIQFDKEGYIFVVNYEGNVMMNRGNRSLIGKNILNVTDSNGIRVAEEVIKLAQTPDWDGYFNYTWKKLSSSKVSPKIAYHKMVQDWDWYYGAGIYIDDIENILVAQKTKLKNDLLLNLFLIAFTVIIVLTFIVNLAKKNTKKLSLDLIQIQNFFNNISTESEPLNTTNLKFSEFILLGESANKMLEKQKTAEEQRKTLERTVQHSQKMDAVSQMVGGIAHDFNNLLGVILGYGELIESKLSDQPKLEKFCRQINLAGKRGARLTQKLLSLTRTTDAENKRCDINNLLNEEKEFLNKSLTAVIKLEFNLENNLWPAMLNRNDFEDAILNLCVNAMHAMKEGQQDSSITITTNNFHYNDSNIIELATGDYVQVTVRDNGAGMSSEVKERLFEPFYTTRDTGTGLGLSQVYNFAKRSQGAIRVISTPGSGAEFQLFFPRDKEIGKVEQVKIQPNENIDAKRSETILVVDDEEPLRTLCAEILSSKGYKILQAENGVDALAVLENEKVDLLLSDIIMPNMDGNLLAERVKKLYPYIKIQLISGYSEENQRSEANIDLYDNMLHKPVDTTTLLNRVRQLLDSE